MADSDAPVRRRDAIATKARILAAAKKCFSQYGYTNSSVRDVAAEAGVSYALLGRYFGSKADLFAQAMRSSPGIQALDGFERASFGESIARHLVERLTGDTAFAMSLLSGGEPDAQATAMIFMETDVIEPLSRWIGEPLGRERTVAISMLMAGFLLHARCLPLLGPPDEIAMTHPIVRWLAEQLQAIVDQPERWKDGGAGGDRADADGTR